MLTLPTSEFVSQFNEFQPNNVWSDLKHVYVWEDVWAVVSRDDVDSDSPILIHDLPSAENSDNDKTYDDYIITKLTG